jgi:glutathione S-transferase
VRLALEDAGLDYVDVARGPKGPAPINALLADKRIATPPFAPPILKAGRLVIGQTANILLYLGNHHASLAPASEAGRLWAHQLQLTITDFIKEVQDTHHPYSGDLKFEDQMAACKITADDFLENRAPKFLGYFERVLAQNPSGPKHLVGAKNTYVDLSLFNVVEGMRFAFPKAMKRFEAKAKRVVALHDRVAERPRMKDYMNSPRRLPEKSGTFRHYPALDA